MPQVVFTNPTPADAHTLAANMRQQDVDEVHAAGHADLLTVIEEGIRCSTMCWACHVDGELAAIFGCAPMGTLLDPRGCPWLLGTDLIPRHRRIFVRESRPYIAAMLAAYPSLINAVHADNTVAVSWLRKMGFHLEPAAPVHTGALFHVFSMSR